MSVAPSRRSGGYRSAAGSSSRRNSILSTIDMDFDMGQLSNNGENLNFDTSFGGLESYGQRSS